MSNSGATARKVTIVLCAASALVVVGASARAAVTLGRRVGGPATMPAWKAAVAASAGAHGGSTAPTIGVGANPVAVVVDPSTHTAYVGNGNDNTVSVINTATCNAKVHSGCDQKPPTIAVGPGPVDDAVDLKTDTIYVVALGSDTVSVINGATCNATVRSGCTRTPPTVTVGGGPDGVAIDQVTDTVYVTNDGPNGDNAGHTVSVIDGATCNGRVTSGCGQTAATVNVGFAPAVPAIDQKTDTVYVPNSNPNGAGSVSVINGATCNATVRSGCAQTPPSVPVGPSPFGAAVDEATDTLYVTSLGPNLGSVDVIDGRTCNASVTSGCRHVSARVTVGSVPVGVVVDPRTRSAFVLNQEDSTVSVIDAATCNGRHTTGCLRRPPVIATGFFPGYFDVDAATGTVYVSSQDENSVSVLDGAACSQAHRSGCRHPAPTTTVGDAPQGLAVNQRTNTVYVANRRDNDLSVISAARCNAGHRKGCGRAWPTVSTGVPAQAVAVDERTNTVYTANSDPDNNNVGDTVSVIDAADCNAQVTSGCRQAPGMVKVGNGPYALTVNDRTNTIYVANGTDNTVSVINGATCDATVRSGCGQTPATISVPAGDYVGGVDVDKNTDTLYVEVANGNTGMGGVWVIDGATCNGTVASGCGKHSTASIRPDIYPSGIHIDEKTDSAYVVDFTHGFAGRVAVIDGAKCNAHVTQGCHRAPATMQVDSPDWFILDGATDTLYVDSILESNAQVFDASICNGKVTSGCGQKPASVPLGGWPGAVGVDEVKDTVYVAQNVDGEVSFFRGNARAAH